LIVIDSSALIAVVNRESERPQFLKLIEAADKRLISTATLLETKMVVLGRFGPDALMDFMLLVEEWPRRRSVGRRSGRCRVCGFRTVRERQTFESCVEFL
jgi:uncharacterized protein with PIN domain